MWVHQFRSYKLLSFLAMLGSLALMPKPAQACGWLLNCLFGEASDTQDSDHLLRDIRTDAEWEAELNSLIEQASTHFASLTITAKTTVIFDIDGTALTRPTREKLTQRINPVWRLYQYLQETLGLKIIFLSARTDLSPNVTRDQLKRHGYWPVGNLILMSLPELSKLQQPSEKSVDQKVAAWKEQERVKLVESGLDIVGVIDDEPLNLEGAHVGYTVQIPKQP